MGCGSSKGGSDGGNNIDPEEVKEDVEAIMNKHLDPILDTFNGEVVPALISAGAPSMEEEHELDNAKDLQVRQKVWDDGKYQNRLDEAEKKAGEELESDVWPEIESKLPPDGMKRKIGEKVARGAMENARAGSVKGLKSECLTTPEINRLLKDKIASLAKLHTEPFIQGPFKELQDRKLADLSKPSLDAFDTAAEFKDFHKQCVKEADTAEVEAKLLADFEEKIIPVVHKRLAWNGTPLDSMKGKVIVKGIDAGKGKMVAAPVKGLIAASEKERIEKYEEKDELKAAKGDSGDDAEKKDGDNDSKEEEKKDDDGDENKEEEKKD